MERSELLSTNEIYGINCDDWKFYQAAYKGTKALIEWGVLTQFESDVENFNARKKAAFGFNYSKRITNIIADFLRETPFEESVKDVADDKLWQIFIKDCDLIGTNWENFWSKKRRWAAVFGHCGVLVDKAKGAVETREEEIKKGIYPYLAYYSPLNILDWKYGRSEVTNRPNLIYLKLIENEDTVRIWTKEKWEVWKLPEKSDEMPELVGEGKNPLKEIPFVWFGNGQDGGGFGDSISDIADIAMIDASMVRDASNADEVITNAAFPMLALPKEEIVEGGENSPVEVGATRIIEFEPGRPGDKPFWMESKVKDCIDVILSLWVRKSEEMYGMANLGVIKEMTGSKTARSGDAMKESFRFLNATLSEKVDSEIEARLKCIKYWMMWQGYDAEKDEVTINHEKKFNAEKLLMTIDDAIKAKSAVDSKKFIAEVEKMISKRILSNLTGEKMEEIWDEIEENSERPKDGIYKPTKKE